MCIFSTEFESYLELVQMGKILSLALLELFYLLCSEILIACQLREILKNLIVLGILNSVPLIFFQGHKAIFHRITFKS